MENGLSGEKEENAVVCCNISSDDEREVGGKRIKTKISTVWQYFKRSSDKKLAKCLTCRREYKTSGNTSNLKDHLKRMHPTINGNESSSASTSAHSSCRSLHSYFKRAVEYEDTSARKADIDKALAQFVAEYYEPYSIVENAAFKQFLNVLDPRYKVPSKTTLKNVLIKERYENSKAALFNRINDVDDVAITTDCWTSIAQESYLTITCHFTEKDFVLRSAVLSTKKMIEVTNHTASNIANSLSEIFTEWNIANKISCVVTDNAKSMIKACDILKLKHLPCFAHSLNLVVQDALKGSENLNDIILKCKSIVRFFKSSSIAYEKLKSEQMTETPLKLIQDVSTRWNSTYDMIERLLKLKDAVSATLLTCLKAPIPLTAEENMVLYEVERLLRPFKLATEQLCGNFVTQSLIIPVVHGLFNKMSEIDAQIDSIAGRTLCKSLIAGIRSRLFFYETRTSTRMATLIDPRFKKEGFLMPTNAEQAVLRLEAEIMMFNTTSVRRLSISSPPTTNSTFLFSFLEEKNALKNRNRQVDAIILKRQYLERENSAQDTNPLMFWKLMESDFNPMKRCATKYLSIPATSCESERTFSTAGTIISQERSRLKDKNVDILIFLAKNKWVLK